MAQREGIHDIDELQRQQNARLLANQLENSLREMERWTEEECKRLKMNSATGAAVDKAWRKVIAKAKKYLVVPRHTPVEQRFLKMMLRLALAESPGLIKDVEHVARYLSRDYPFEWLISPCTRLARAEGRASLIALGESEFGETPYAGQFAFMLYHARQYAIKNASDSNDVYSHALFMEQRAFFANRDPQRRQQLGLHKQALQRQNAKDVVTEPDKAKAPEPPKSAGRAW
jgi:hypothetical protein